MLLSCLDHCLCTILLHNDDKAVVVVVVVVIVVSVTNDIIIFFFFVEAWCDGCGFGGCGRGMGFIQCGLGGESVVGQVGDGRCFVGCGRPDGSVRGESPATQQQEWRQCGPRGPFCLFWIGPASTLEPFLLSLARRSTPPNPRTLYHHHGH